MGTTIRQMRRFIQKMAKKAGLDEVDSKLATDCIVGICKTGSRKISDIVRALGGKKNLCKETRFYYDGLFDPKSNLDSLRDTWLNFVASTANKMPFIAVDPSDILKPYGKDFDFLDIVRDASDRDKSIGPGFPTVQIEATNFMHVNLPLLQETFSTQHPDYRDWYDFIGRAVMKVLFRVGKVAVWLFDRGFDAGDFYTILHGLDIRFVGRRLQSRNVIFGDNRTILMSNLAASISKPHGTDVPYVDKKSHKPKSCPVKFGYVPVRLKGREKRYWMIVITDLRGDDMVLLTNDNIRTIKQAERIVQAYMRRWGVEEGIFSRR